jgi:5'(3')-deoxyribonucleotidase
VIIVTSVPKCAGLAYEGKLEWLRKHIPSFDLNNFIATKRKELVQADILFDDSVDNLRKFNAAGKTAVAFDRPWNQDWEGPRVKNWDELLEYVDNFKKEKK